MFAITGITGRVGGAVASALIEAGHAVRAVVRDPARGAAWRHRGCEVAVASLDDGEALARAFDDADGVFFVLPPVFDPAPGFAEARRVIPAVHAALAVARPGRLVSLSTIGAHVDRTSLLLPHHWQEATLGTLPMPTAFLRAAWFMENAAWDIDVARATGVVPSFLQPLDRPIAMVATADVGRMAAGMLGESWQGSRVVELMGRRLSPDDVAAGLSRVLGSAVRMEAAPRDRWEALFQSQGMRDPTPRMQMLDGFNAGWIDFEQANGRILRGDIGLDTVLRALVEASVGGGVAQSG